MIPLKAESISFKRHSIVYSVKSLEKIDLFSSGFVVCDKSISNKDLVLKPTKLDHINMEVVFVPVNVTVEFYEKIFLNLGSKFSQNHKSQANDIYKVGDVVGYLVLSP